MSQRIERIIHSAAQAARFIDDALHPVRTRDREFHTFLKTLLETRHNECLNKLRALEEQDPFSLGHFEGLCRLDDGNYSILTAGRSTFQIAEAMRSPSQEASNLISGTALTLRFLAPSQEASTQSGTLSPAVLALEANRHLAPSFADAEVAVTLFDMKNSFVLSVKHTSRLNSPFIKHPYSFPQGNWSIVVGKDVNPSIAIYDGDSSRQKTSDRDRTIIDQSLQALDRATAEFVQPPTGSQILRPLSTTQARGLFSDYARFVGLFADHREDFTQERDLLERQQQLSERLKYIDEMTAAVIKQLDREIARLEGALGLTDKHKVYLVTRRVLREQVIANGKYDQRNLSAELAEIAEDLAPYEASDHSWKKLSPEDVKTLTVCLRHPDRMKAAAERLQILQPSIDLPLANS